MDKRLTADKALEELIKLHPTLAKRQAKAILNRLAQDAYRRGFNNGAREERGADHE